MTSISKLLGEFHTQDKLLDISPSNALFGAQFLRTVMAWTNKDIQLAVNEKRIILLEYEDGGQLFCCPGSCWDPNNQK